MSSAYTYGHELGVDAFRMSQRVLRSSSFLPLRSQRKAAESAENCRVIFGSVSQNLAFERTGWTSGRAGEPNPLKFATSSGRSRYSRPDS